MLRSIEERDVRNHGRHRPSDGQYTGSRPSTAGLNPEVAMENILRRRNLSTVDGHF